MKHAYEFVQISAFTMNDQLFFYGISDATESGQRHVDMAYPRLEWKGVAETQSVHPIPSASGGEADGTCLYRFLPPFGRFDDVINRTL